MNPKYLKSFSNQLRTSMGACFPGEKAVFRGHDLHKEFSDIEWFDLYVYGITGRRFTQKKLTLLQSLWTYTSYPDARIWNNRVASLSGNSRSTANLAISAALATSEADIFGRGIDIKAISFLKRTADSIKQGRKLKDCIIRELKNNRGIAGYGRPIASGDERIKPIMEKAESLGLANGIHIKLAYQVDDFLTKGRWRIKMNYGIISAALAADMGLSPSEYVQFSFPAFLAGMQPCYTEAVRNPVGTLFPTACKEITYEGKEKRSWKRN